MTLRRLCFSILQNLFWTNSSQIDHHQSSLEGLLKQEWPSHTPEGLIQ